MPKSKPLYANMPVAPKKKIAATNPLGTAQLGSATPRSVPQKEPTIHGLDIVPHSFKVPSIKGAKGFGNIAKVKQGHLRLSGNPKAHKVGSK